MAEPRDDRSTPHGSATGWISVQLCWSPGPRAVEERDLRLPRGSTIRDLISDPVARAACPSLALDPSGLDMGIWGRRAQLDDALREGDRVELYRPLTVDPKYARRERFRRQGARTTGLFASRRPGGKAGY